MNRYVFSALALSLCAALPADAGIDFSPDGSGAGNTVVIGGFDWLPGNALADGGNLAIANFALNTGGSTQFNLFYQARVFNLGTSGGGSIITDQGTIFAPVGSEYTIVAGFREEVISFDNSDSSAVQAAFGFVPGAPNFLEIYYDTTPDASDFLGTGFTDGRQILSATVTSVTASTFTADLDAGPEALDQTVNGNQYPALQTIKGSGSTDLSALVTSYDQMFFPNLNLTNLNILFQIVSDFDATQTIPFDSVDPSQRFTKVANAMGVTVADGAGDPNNSIGSTNGAFTGVNGFPDVVFEADGNQTFITSSAVVPEPASCAVWAVIGLGVVPMGRRMRKRQAQANA